MKIIPKIALYAVMILLLSISLDRKTDSQAEPPKPAITSNKSQSSFKAAPYSIGSKIKIKNPVYTERVVINSNLELDH